MHQNESLIALFAKAGQHPPLSPPPQRYPRQDVPGSPLRLPCSPPPGRPRYLPVGPRPEAAHDEGRGHGWLRVGADGLGVDAELAALAGPDHGAPQDGHQHQEQQTPWHRAVGDPVTAVRPRLPYSVALWGRDGPALGFAHPRAQPSNGRPSIAAQLSPQQVPRAHGQSALVPALTARVCRRLEGRLPDARREWGPRCAASGRRLLPLSGSTERPRSATGHLAPPLLARGAPLGALPALAPACVCRVTGPGRVEGHSGRTCQAARSLGAARLPGVA